MPRRPSSAGVENHRDRPEVAAALAGGRQSASRWSATVHERLMYAAVPMTLPDGARGAARLGRAARRGRGRARARSDASFWAALRIALGWSQSSRSSIAAQMLSRALRRMTEAARRMAAGDLEVRTARRPATTRWPSSGAALDAMAGSLAATLDRRYAPSAICWA